MIEGKELSVCAPFACRIIRFVGEGNFWRSKMASSSIKYAAL